MRYHQVSMAQIQTVIRPISAMLRPILLWGTVSQRVVKGIRRVPAMRKPMKLKKALERRAMRGVRALVLTGIAVPLGAS